jgi:uncharacterized protein (DUF305 family)
MPATVDDSPDVDHSLDEDDGDRGAVAMFSLLQTIAIVALAVVLAVGLTLFFTGDDEGSFNEADIGFLSDMTTHHQGAITLGFEYLPNENDSVVGHTAREVVLNQSQEIATMNNFLTEAGDAADQIQGDDVAMEWMGHPVDPADMPGMATAEELEQLAAASGVEADDLFSRLMIAHHAAGAEMAEYEAEHGENETVRSFAAKVAKIQRIEIAELNERREALGLEPVEPESFSVSGGSGHE